MMKVCGKLQCVTVTKMRPNPGQFWYQLISMLKVYGELHYVAPRQIHLTRDWIGVEGLLAVMRHGNYILFHWGNSAQHWGETTADGMKLTLMGTRQQHIDEHHNWTITLLTSIWPRQLLVIPSDARTNLKSITHLTTGTATPIICNAPRHRFQKMVTEFPLHLRCYLWRWRNTNMCTIILARGL